MDFHWKTEDKKLRLKQQADRSVSFHCTCGVCEDSIYHPPAHHGQEDRMDRTDRTDRTDSRLCIQASCCPVNPSPLPTPSLLPQLHYTHFSYPYSC